MRAIRKLAPEPAAVELVEAERPAPSHDEALVGVAAAGVCGTDVGVYQWTGYEWVEPPVTLGHEFAGTVVETGGAVCSVAEGDEVVAMPNRCCGECRPCRQGDRHVCENPTIVGIHVDGGMADFVRVPEEQLLAVPDDMPLHTAAVAEPAAVGVHATDVHVTATDDVVVVQGVGPIGVLTAYAIRARTSRPPIIVGTTADETVRFPLVRDLGFDTVNVEDGDLGTAIRDHAGGHGADVVVDATGHPRGIEQAIDVVGNGGTVVVVGTPHEPSSLNVSEVVRSEIEIRGSFAARQQDFDPALELLRNHVDAEAVTTTVDPTDPTSLFEAMDDNRVIKPVFDFAQEGEQ